MALLYLILALFVMFMNIDKLPAVLSLIFKSAFGLQEAAAGGLGYAIAQAMINGIKRAYSQTKLVWVLRQTQQHQQHLIRHTLRLRAMFRC